MSTEWRQPDLATSRLFEPWRDPDSGVTSWLLTARVASLQQSFYYTNPSFTHDGRYYWLYGADPPAGNARDGRGLARVDFVRDELYAVPDSQFTEASPGVDLDSGQVYWSTPEAVWKRGPLVEDATVHVANFPPPELGATSAARTATHFTLSADGRELNIDAQVGNRFFVGSLPLDGRPFELWQEMERLYDHGQFHPTDPDLMLVTQEDSRHPETGGTAALRQPDLADPQGRARPAAVSGPAAHRPRVVGSGRRAHLVPALRRRRHAEGAPAHR